MSCAEHNPDHECCCTNNAAKYNEAAIQVHVLSDGRRRRLHQRRLHFSDKEADLHEECVDDEGVHWVAWGCVCINNDL